MTSILRIHSPSVILTQRWAGVWLPDNRQFPNLAGARVQACRSSGSPTTAGNDVPDGSVDMFLSTYVLDILSDEDIGAVLSLAYR